MLLGLGGTSLSLSDSGLGLCHTLGEEGSVLGGELLLLLGVSSLDGHSMSLVLQSLWCHKSLDLGCLCVCLLSLLGDLSSDHKLSYIIFLGQVEELADLGGTLWSKTFWLGDIGESGDIGLALLDDCQGEDGEVVSRDATSNGFSLSLARSSGSVARVTLREQESDSGRVEDTLLHRETLFVVSSRDLEDVPLELIADRVPWHFVSHSLVHEDTDFSLIVNVNQFVRPIGWV